MGPDNWSFTWSVSKKKSPRWRPSSADAQGAALTCKFREGWQKLFISNYSSWVSRKNCVILPAVDRITQISHNSLDWLHNAIFPTCIHRFWEGYLNPSLYVIDFLHFSQWSLEAHFLKCSQRSGKHRSILSPSSESIGWVWCVENSNRNQRSSEQQLTSL